ncbi:hypothetical protein K6V26_10370 [Parabacteroides goldsteinii]|uniref:fimbrial protein n=1 Tax=Parabacteroides goldsteinii TaxID=328812 RepID=UPI001CCD917E|nr:fimbrial protein [Parabacteroides goldsteinii]UBD76684.1 hypothetical protein K6V26_10370 [Parabacteroides goldsteinii]
MKRSKIYLLLLSGLLLAACSKEDEPSPTLGDEDAFATVSVAVDGVAGTKATKADTDPGTTAENEIYDLNVVFINSNNEVAGRAFRKIDDAQDTIRVGLKTGTYKLLVIANAGEMSSFKPEKYYDKTVSLADQVGKSAGQVGEKGFIMTNIAQDVEIKKTAENDGINLISEKVKRVVGRVDLSQVDIDNDWLDKNLKGMKFKLSQVFLVNVRPQSYLYDTKTGWTLPEGATLHTMEFIEDHYLCGIEEKLQVGGEIATGSEYAEYLTTATDVTITGDNSELHKGIASFYAMTNSFAKDGVDPVILYLKGSWYDATGKPALTDRYYRIKLQNGVQRNTIYKIEATLKGKGSPDPDIKDDVTLSVTITVKSWEGKTLDVITINEEIEI